MKEYLEKKINNIRKIHKIRGDASSRDFYRVFFDYGTFVAMVYPSENKDEISRVIHFTDIYKQHHISVPGIVDIIDDRVVIQEDLGSESIQKIFPRINRDRQKDLITRIADILFKIRQISVTHSESSLDKQRMTREMDFFLTHFSRNFFKTASLFDTLKKEINSLVSRITNSKCFLHRDFHSRNMMYHQENIYLLDFQDSLIGPEYYDMVSFAFDSYLDLNAQREIFFDYFEEAGNRINREQLYLTALQRNIKALGIFGFQLIKKRKRAYKKYIPRTVHHISGNPLAKSLLPTLYSLFQSKDFKI